MELLNFINKWLTKKEDQNLATQMETIKNSLYDHLMTSGEISKSQRMEVLKNLVEKVKKESSEKVIKNQIITTEIEKANDTAKSISLFNLI